MEPTRLAPVDYYLGSRDEPDIRQALCPLAASDIVLKNEEIDKDIRNYISYELETN
jgi:hypothetical protein